MTFEYDENARPFRMIDGTGTAYWHYDERGAVDWRQDAFGTTYFVYDDAGRRTAIVNAAGETTYYEYDDANRVTVVVSPFGDATTYQYLNNDLTQSATMGNDVATSYDYDTGNRIRSITHRRLSDSADLGSFTYEYDANSNRVKLSFSGDAVPPGCEVKYITYQYTPESVDRLETENYWDAQDGLVFCIDYRYDLCGNRVLRMRQPAESGRESATTYYDTNELNQLTRAVDVERDEEFQTYLIGATYFEYDQAGNTVTRLSTDEDGILTGATYYDWDAESQLTGVRSLAGLSNAFTYDGRYQRVGKEEAAGTVRYNWDGLNVLLERDGEDEPLATHTHGPVPIAGIGTHLTTRRHGETPEDLWVHHDAIGSTRQLSGETQPPALTRQNLLDAWGNVLATAGTQDTPYRFTGKETDEDTGLIYFGRRFYDPVMGRWLNRDPARDGQNWYEYAASNPMARVDAEGLAPIPPFEPGQEAGYEFKRGAHGPHSVWLEGDKIVVGFRFSVYTSARTASFDDLTLNLYAKGALKSIQDGFSTAGPSGHGFFILHKPTNRLFSIECRVFADVDGGNDPNRVGADPIEVVIAVSDAASRPGHWNLDADDRAWNAMVPLHETWHLATNARDEYGWRLGSDNTIHAYAMKPALGDKLLLGTGNRAFGPSDSVMCGLGTRVYPWHLRGLVDELNGQVGAVGTFSPAEPLRIRRLHPDLDARKTGQTPWALADVRGRPVNTGFWGVQPEFFGSESWWNSHGRFPWEKALCALAVADRVLRSVIGGM